MKVPLPAKFEGQEGPAVRALPNDHWRTFVFIYCAQGRRSATAAYKAAFPNAGDGTARTAASKMLHDERVQKAILEVCQRQLRTLAPLAIDVFAEIAENPQAAAGDRLRAAQAIADRTGLSAVTEHKTTVQHIGQDSDQMKRIATLATILGIPAEQLLGKRLGEEAPMIDVTPDPEPDPEPEPVDDPEIPTEW